MDRATLAHGHAWPSHTPFLLATAQPDRNTTQTRTVTGTECDNPPAQCQPHPSTKLSRTCAKVWYAIKCLNIDRRIRKTVSNWVSNKFSPVPTNRYVYDGWNLFVEANPGNVT